MGDNAPPVSVLSSRILLVSFCWHHRAASKYASYGGRERPYGLRIFSADELNFA